MTHRTGRKSLHMMTSSHIDRTLSMEKICIACGVATGMPGQTQKTFASESLINSINLQISNEIYIVRSWYDEMKQYIWNVEPRGAFKAGQFSQMVWKQSKELGVGLGRTKTGKVVVVASKYQRFPEMIQLNLLQTFTSSLLPTRQYNRTVFAQCEEN